MEANIQYFKNNWFLHGYRTFIHQGRKWKAPVGGKKASILLDTNVEPFDDLTEEEKTHWRRGMEYAKTEKEEISKIEEQELFDSYLEKIRSGGYFSLLDKTKAIKARDYLIKKGEQVIITEYKKYKIDDESYQVYKKEFRAKNNDRFPSNLFTLNRLRDIDHKTATIRIIYYIKKR